MHRARAGLATCGLTLDKAKHENHSTGKKITRLCVAKNTLKSVQQLPQKGIDVNNS
jgi:hypothetical protein